MKDALHFVLIGALLSPCAPVDEGVSPTPSERPLAPLTCLGSVDALAEAASREERRSSGLAARLAEAMDDLDS